MESNRRKAFHWPGVLAFLEFYDIKLNAQALFDERGKNMKRHHSQNQSKGTCCLPWELFRLVLHPAILAQDLEIKSV